MWIDIRSRTARGTLLLLADLGGLPFAVLVLAKGKPFSPAHFTLHQFKCINRGTSRLRF
jgi:hypothetical protein